MPLRSQSIAGRWMTIDDNTGKKRSIVEIKVTNGTASGRIVQLFRGPGEEQDPVCKECTDDRKGRKVIGLDIIRDMVLSNREWTKGTILDPENGKVYDCKLWVENGTLKVRGYVAFFFRTQTWVREPG
ncbi:MAG: DUF2147 domain-containing protein [Flavobacteriales bacterium]|nr:DUF2147 domain-containing protein [Flavobacteriales bacterium]